MQAHLPTATALSNLWLLMMLLPGGTEAASTIPTKTAIIILAVIAAVYFIVTVLCVAIIILWIVCSQKRSRYNVTSHSQYGPQGGDSKPKKPPRHREPLPKKKLTHEGGIAIRSISQDYLRKDGGVVTYTATPERVTIAEKPSSLIAPCPVRPSPLLVAKEKPAAPNLDVTVIENKYWEEGSNSSGSRSDEVFERQPPPSEPTSSVTIEERRKEARSSRKKGRTDSSRPLLNGSESRGPSESGEPDVIPLSDNISPSQQAVTQDPPDYPYPKHEAPRRKKPSLDRTDSTKPLLTRSDSSEPATPTDSTPSPQNIFHSQRATTQDPRDSKKPKHKFASGPKRTLSSGRVASEDLVVTNRQYASVLPDTKEEEEDDAEGHETML